jgi:hypothetical protein
MNDKRHLGHSNKAGFMLNAVMLIALTGCVARIEGPSFAVRTEPVFVAQDDYVYYPAYDVYYSSYRHQYAYLDGGAWVSRPGPRGVSVNVLLASPSVRMDFHDLPANHHADMVRRYPKNWKPTAPGPGRNENRTEDRRDEPGNNNRR